MALIISDCIVISSRVMIKNGQPVLPLKDAAILPVTNLYRELPYEYPKFFKMDILSKWAWLGTECLLNYNNNIIYNHLHMNKVAVVLATRDGCIEADKKYKETISAIPSPALFVYTLPNIMLGEVCIRHGFKGEQLCMVSDEPDFGELYFWTKDVLENRCMDACLCGWVNATGNDKEVSLFWVTKSGRGPQLSAAVMQQIHDTGR